MLLTILLACPKAPPKAPPPTLEERIAYLDARLEHMRQEQGIPGMAVAVTWNDEVVLSKGYGLADIEAQTPVTDTTAFAVGSTTKAFTSALLANRVDAGEMAWDDPVSKHLPEFTLSTDDEATVADLLSHQTGLTRMPMAWGNTQRVTLPDLLLATSRAQLFGEFENSWHYNNVMYAVAGSLVGDWEASLQDEILDPLGMADSRVGPPTTTVGYRLTDQPVRVVTRDLSGVMAPAGGLTSTAQDMVKWLDFQLDADGALAETHATAYEMGPGMGYGLGWMVVESDFGTVVEHGGNIEGFSAHAALLPEQDLGVVWMSNVMMTPMQHQVRSVVTDALLTDDWNQPTPGEDLERYVGDYDAAFLRETLTVTNDNGTLKLGIPGQGEFGLRPPDKDGLRAFKLTKQIQVEFIEADGEVTGLVLHQAGSAFSAPHEDHIPTEEPARYARYLGSYIAPEETLKVRIVHGQLALDMPSQLVFPLDDPDKDGLWRMVGLPGDQSVRFEEEDGVVTGMVLVGGGEEVLAPRQQPATDLPTDEDLRALLPVWDGHPCVEEGTVRFVHQGVEGTYVAAFSEDVLANRMELPSGVDGFIATREQVRLESDFQEDLVLTEDVFLDIWWADHPSLPGTFTVLGTGEVDGRPVWEAQRVNGAQPPDTWYIAQDNGDVLQRDMELVTPFLADMRIQQTLRFYDHVDGDPKRVEVENVHTGILEMTSESQVCGEDVVVSPDALPQPAATPEEPAEAEEESSE